MQSIAIIPAAGRSRRMGTAKLVLPWRGATILDHVLGAWGASRVTHIVIVARAEDEALAVIARSHNVALVQADPPPEHMKDSVALGLAYARRTWAPAPSDVWLLAPADMPRLSPAAIDRLLDEHDPQSPQILVPRAGEQNGHPVLFPWPLAAEVETLGSEEGINVLRNRHSYRAIPVDDPTALDDLDTPEDYGRLGT